MTNPIGSLTSSVPAAIGGPVLEQATRLLSKATAVPGAPDLRRVADDVIDIAEAEPGHAADLLEAMKPQLSSAERKRLAEDMAQSADAKGTQENQSTLSRTGSLALDMAQLALSIAGIFDPTPTCDAIDGVISLLRGDYVGAAISAVSMVPYVGDLAKAGKLGKLVEATGEAADLCKQVPGFAAQIAPHVADARQALGKVDASAVRPELVDGFHALRGQLDRFADEPARGALDVMREMKAQPSSARAHGPITRLDELLPDPPVKVITADERALEELLQSGAGAKQADALAERIQQLARSDSAPAAVALRPAHTPDAPRGLEPIPARLLEHIGARPVERTVFRNADEMLAHFGLHRIADHEEHLALWRQAHATVSGPDRCNKYTTALDKLAAGEELTSKEARAAFSYVRGEFGRLFQARYGHPPADVEHVINLSICPNLALDPTNLVVTHTGLHLGTKQHELLHWIKSGGDSHNDPRTWWMQIYANETERFRQMTPEQVGRAVQELMEQYGLKKP